MEITRHDGTARGRYEARVPGHDGVAELTYSKLGDTTLVADHTGVPESLRGQGVGQALVERLIADAREQGLTIVPLCSFVKVQSERHPEWSDVVRSD